MAKIDANISDVLGELQGLIDRIENQQPVWNAVGELLIASTRRRFATSTAPDGSSWLANKPSTVDNFLRKRSGTRTKRGAVSAKGKRLVGNKKPLIGDSRQLSQQIIKQASRTGVTIGSNRIYAATQQFGAKKGSFGSDSRGRSIPWGDIPARPFLGLDDNDRAAIRDAFLDYLDTG